jgi:predicted lipid-binding transport protein (Tim44 family)
MTGVNEAWTILVGALLGLTALAVFLLVVLIGFSLFGDSTKFRPRRHSRTIRDLDESLGRPAAYLPPDAPRGPVDQLAGSK